jgi:DNA polymerase III alpha subunit (gram-positive type)
MDAKYLIIDIEATGLSAWENGLIQLAWVVLNSDLDIIDKVVLDINPPSGYKINEEALKINGFTVERIERGVTYNDACDSFTNNLRRYFTYQKPICIGQFFPFDYKMLEMMYSKVGRYKEFESILGNEFIDTKALVLALNLNSALQKKEIPFPITSLSKPGGLKSKFRLDFDSHDALGDCMGTRLVLLEILKYLN